MNRNVVAIVLIIIAIALIWVFAWPRMKPYFAPPLAPSEQTTGTPGMPMI